MFIDTLAIFDLLCVTMKSTQPIMIENILFYRDAAIIDSNVCLSGGKAILNCFCLNLFNTNAGGEVRQGVLLTSDQW